jgi:hypothetical protein
MKTRWVNNVKSDTRESIASFWDQEGAKDCKAKQGCYVFALKVAKGYNPCYVGKAMEGFAQECFTPGKLRKYENARAGVGRGAPVLFFVTADRIVPKKKTIDQLETFLIHEAYSENPDNLQQKAKIGSAPKWGIQGVIRGGKGPPTKGEKAFAKLMGL